MNEKNNDVTSAFRMPGANEWRALQAIGSGKEEIERARHAQEELRNVLLASLQMEHLVVLAGLGCSLSAGGPSMRDLWNGAVGETPTENAKTAADKVQHKIADQNIERFLSRIEAFLQVNENDTEAKKFLDASKQVILDRCSNFLETEKLEPHRTFLHRLSRRRARDQRLQIFTTNYDLCFEQAATQLGGLALDGFSFTSPRRYDPRFYGYDIIRRPRRGDDSGSYLEGVFLLYKLHGSVNWARSADGLILEKAKPSPSEACLIYPASGKYQQSFVQPHLEAMAQYLTAVREPNTCLLVVGFGFNDDHIAAPLQAAAQSNPHLRVAIVDPQAEARAQNADGNRFWKELFELSLRGEDIWFIRSTFEAFAALIPDLKSLTPAEALLRAIKQAGD